MIKTAESVTPNHPDKICDRISDAILDACLEQDPMSRCAIETMGGHGIITITGELTTKAYVNIHDIVKKIVGDKYGIQTNIVKQSPEIAQGVDNEGAGDQGIMVGYACDDNEMMIPQELFLARWLCKYIYELYPYDGKTQVTIDDDGAVISVVASFQHAEGENLAQLVTLWMDENGIGHHSNVKIHANPAGDWKIGGFEADTGLTGRKLIVDNYGPGVPIGGGCFSGKDATKVDRSAAYMARYLAVQLLNTKIYSEVIVQLAYAIGVAQPIMAVAKVKFKITDHIVELNILQNKEGLYLLDGKFYNLTPKGIIDFLDLRKPQFSSTAEWGHFGNNFKWDINLWETKK